MKLFEYSTIDSTNLEAARLWQSRSAAGGLGAFAVVAQTQTGGMGRQGRSWASPIGGLWLSVVWPLRRALENYQALPLAAGLAVAETVETLFGIKPLIKWPNDVLVKQKKLAGILCQGDTSGPQAAIIAGIGINGNFAAASLTGSLRQPPTTLQDETGHAVDLVQLRTELLAALDHTLETFDGAIGITGVLEKVTQRLAWRGSMVRCADTLGNVLAVGILESLSVDGAVCIRTAEELKTLASGELQLVQA